MSVGSGWRRKITLLVFAVARMWRRIRGFMSRDEGGWDWRFVFLRGWDGCGMDGWHGWDG